MQRSGWTAYRRPGGGAVIRESLIWGIKLTGFQVSSARPDQLFFSYVVSNANLLVKPVSS